MNCSQFCAAQKNLNNGLNANIVHSGRREDNPFPAGLQKCPLGFTHNPEDIDKVENLIRNGGRMSICHRNPFKWMKLNG